MILVITMGDHLRKLANHLKWADSAVLGSLRAATNASPRALQLYAHVVAAESVWLARVAGREPDVAVWPSITLDQAEARAARNAIELDAIVETLTPGDLTRVIDYRTSAGRPFSSTLEDILLHVALHGVYHRGQISMLLRDGGDEPAPTDYIAFARGSPAARTIPPSLDEQPR